MVEEFVYVDEHTDNTPHLQMHPTLNLNIRLAFI